ncbi:hypothetical protein [Streptomyces scabiei]|uniref:hypothetical protein n=1 Tax=Streptomyces scabiei TaxID=1930 RepID=UPI0029B06A3C|nr:hypothetical protein [Streptomyces scabiei]MDX3524431.1 hypothetical protein [Streptomyces scabiei]
MNDDETWMAWFIKKYDNTEDPDLRAELLMCHGIHPQVLASERRRLARRAQSQPTEQTTTPFVPPVPRRSRATRRPTTPRRAGSPRTYQIKVTRTKKIRSAKRTATIVTVTTTFTTITTVTTVTTVDS